MIPERDERFGVLVKRDVAAVVFVEAFEQRAPRAEEAPKPTVFFRGLEWFWFFFEIGGRKNKQN